MVKNWIDCKTDPLRPRFRDPYLPVFQQDGIPISESLSTRIPDNGVPHARTHSRWFRSRA